MRLSRVFGLALLASSVLTPATAQHVIPSYAGPGIVFLNNKFAVNFGSNPGQVLDAAAATALTAAAQSTANAALPRAGGAMAGPLLLSGDPTSPLGAATQQYVLAHAGGAAVAAYTALGPVVINGNVISLAFPAGVAAPATLSKVAATNSYPDLSNLPTLLVTGTLAGQARDAAAAIAAEQGALSLANASGNQAVAAQAAAMAALPKAGGTMAGPLLLSGDPTSPLGAATQQYVLAHAAGAYTALGPLSISGSGAISLAFPAGVAAPAALSKVAATNSYPDLSNLPSLLVTGTQAGQARDAAAALAAEQAAQAAANAAQATASAALPATGGALTGPLTLSGDPTSPLGAATQQYVLAHTVVTSALGPLSIGSGGAISLAFPAGVAAPATLSKVAATNSYPDLSNLPNLLAVGTQAGQARDAAAAIAAEQAAQAAAVASVQPNQLTAEANRAQAAEAAALPKAGGTMAGPLTLAGDPTTALQAATQQYVLAHASSYVLQPATASVLGGIKPGANLTIAADGTLNATAPSGSGTTYTAIGPVQLSGTTFSLAFPSGVTVPSTLSKVAATNSYPDLSNLPNLLAVGTQAGQARDAAAGIAAEQAAQATASAALPKAGGTLTGPLTLAGDPTAALGAATQQYVLAHAGPTYTAVGPLSIGSGGAISLVFPSGVTAPSTLAKVAATNSYPDLSNLPTLLAVGTQSGQARDAAAGIAAEQAAQAAGNAAATTANAALPKSGGTLTGPLTLAGDPTAALGAATQQYVLAHAGPTYTAVGPLSIGSGGAISLVFPSGVTAPSALAKVAATNSYPDLSNLPTLLAVGTQSGQARDAAAGIAAEQAAAAAAAASVQPPQLAAAITAAAQIHQQSPDYTGTGNIALTDVYSVLNCNTACTITLPPPTNTSVDGPTHTVTNFGTVQAQFALNFYGNASGGVPLNQGSVAVVWWSASHASYLYAN